MKKHILITLLMVMYALVAQAQEGAFITTWKTNTDKENITIPVSTFYKYDFTVDWGDGNTTKETKNAVHTYEKAGTYKVAITGNFPAIQIDKVRKNTSKIQSIDQWGTMTWKSMFNAFQNCKNLTYKATDKPILTEVKNMSGMFSNAQSFNGNIGDWNVENVTDMSFMFHRAIAFNQDIGSWNVSNVVDMSAMFSKATAFNQNIGAWNVSKLKKTWGMFQDAAIFNQDIRSWDVSKVRYASKMFKNASSFNQDISEWKIYLLECDDFSTNSALSLEKLPKLKYCTD